MSIELLSLSVENCSIARRFQWQSGSRQMCVEPSRVLSRTRSQRMSFLLLVHAVALWPQMEGLGIPNMSNWAVVMLKREEDSFVCKTAGHTTQQCLRHQDIGKSSTDHRGNSCESFQGQTQNSLPPSSKTMNCSSTMHGCQSSSHTSQGSVFQSK